MKKQRESYFDNAKFILMVLVVFGHLLQPFIEDHEFYRDIYYTVFTFHMPAFILVSGYFTKNYRRPGYLLRCLRTFLLPYFIFQIIYSFFYWGIGETAGFQIDFSIPHWSLWFLLAMLFWNFFLLVFGHLTPLVSIALSIFVAIIAGYLPFIDRELTLQRTLVFFPFFLIGHFLSPKVFKRLQKKHSRIIGLACFVGIYIFIHINEILNKYWLFGSKPYEDFLSIPELGAIVRSIVFLLGIIGIFSFFSFIPTQKFFFTKWGQNTFNVYLLHGFIVKGLRALSVDSLSLTWWRFLLLIGFSFLLTILLGSERVNNWRLQLKKIPLLLYQHIKK